MDSESIPERRTLLVFSTWVFLFINFLWLAICVDELYGLIFGGTASQYPFGWEGGGWMYQTCANYASVMAVIAVGESFLITLTVGFMLGRFRLKVMLLFVLWTAFWASYAVVVTNFGAL